jgi:hypothetical protein
MIVDDGLLKDDSQKWGCSCKCFNDQVKEKNIVDVEIALDN